MAYLAAGPEPFTQEEYMRTLSFTVAIAIFAVSIALSGQTKVDPAVGTWKLNVEKSKYSPGPAPKSQTLKFEAWDGGLKLTADGVDSEGKPTHAEYAAKFDGKDYPFTGSPNADAIALKRIDDYTIEATWKKGGKVTITARTTISK